MDTQPKFITSTELLNRRGGWAQNVTHKRATMWHKFLPDEGGVGLRAHALCGIYLARFADLHVFSPSHNQGKMCPRCRKKDQRLEDAKTA